MSQFPSFLLNKFREHEGTLLAIILSAFSFLAPLETTFTTVLSLCFIDAFIAIALAIKNKQAIESKKLRGTVGKVLVYFAAITATFLCEVSILGKEPTPGILSKAIISFISITETKSILESLSAFMQQGTKINFWQILLSTLQSKAQAAGIQYPQPTQPQDPNQSNQSTTK